MHFWILDMVHPNVILKPIVSIDIKHVDVKEVDVDIRLAFVTLRCERSDKYRTPIWKFKRDDIVSRKCKCPFKWCDYLLENNKWRFNVISGLHNHDMCDKLVGHPIACRLMPEEKEIVSDMTLNMVHPKNILATLKHKRSRNISISSKYQACDDELAARDIFWTHPNFIKLFNTFFTVLIIDSTYKTNKYKFILLEIIGVTATEKTYSVEFAFFESEKEKNITWTLKMCRTILKDKENTLKVIVTDCDTALMNSIANVFLTS
ncbi:uncharacterized protein LOC127130752 [Lathyrus oleraceus]|uniref:uncharacterized protein LOC127130752 n=1 Tax=Pisum sativum TaxID=3888 RepID=UPI0021CF11C7|nr:uncharacterized protein LOC127130752 [Pisum sativum]